MIDAAELQLLEASQAEHSTLDVVVSSCAYSCCGRGWQRRDGYEQMYAGYVDNLQADEPGTFMLYSVGLGTISYVLALRFDEVELVQARS